MGPGHQPLHVHRVHSVALESLGGKLNCKVHETKLPSTNIALFVKTECMNSRPMAVLWRYSSHLECNISNSRLATVVKLLIKACFLSAVAPSNQLYNFVSAYLDN